MRREGWLCAAAAVVLVLLVLGLTSESVRAKVTAQLSAGSDAADDPPVQVTAPKGIGRYPVHIPRNAHMGRHRMYHHPAACSPNLNAPQQVQYDWMFSPPAEGDL